MRKFSTLLLMGGNVKVGPKHDQTSASPFSITAKTRSARRLDIHHALSAIHDQFHNEHHEHLFGKNKAGLHSGNIYSGSSHDLMHNHVNDDEFAKYKPTVGDIDVQVSHDHKNKLQHTLKDGARFGKYTVVGTKKHGIEMSAVMKHENGEHHQFDFEGSDNPGHAHEKFVHSSSWEDTKKGIKGMHHKMLINAVGGQHHKFSISHGLRSRTDDTDQGTKDPKNVTHKLFGDSANTSKIHSFLGVTDLIKKHTPRAEHQQIYDKFVSSTLQKKDGTDHRRAIKHLGDALEIKQHLNERDGGTQHAHVTFMGASPITHMGHHIDVIGPMDKHAPGRKFVGLSGKSDVFSDKEREDISNKQSAGKAEFKVEKSAGQTVGRAFNSMDNSGRREIHLHFGHDRKEMAERLKSSIEAGKIPELNGQKPDAVHIHYPKDDSRSHGMSGTKMREAATRNDHETFKKHLGPDFTDHEVKTLMSRTRIGIAAGRIKIKR